MWCGSNDPIQGPGAGDCQSPGGTATPAVAARGSRCRRAGDWFRIRITAAQPSNAPGETDARHAEIITGAVYYGFERCPDPSVHQNSEIAKGIRNTRNGYLYQSGDTQDTIEKYIDGATPI